MSERVAPPGTSIALDPSATSNDKHQPNDTSSHNHHVTVTDEGSSEIGTPKTCDDKGAGAATLNKPASAGPLRNGHLLNGHHQVGTAPFNPIQVREIKKARVFAGGGTLCRSDHRATGDDAHDGRDRSRPGHVLPHGRRQPPHRVDRHRIRHEGDPYAPACASVPQQVEC